MSPFLWTFLAYTAVGFLGAWRAILRSWAKDFAPLEGADFGMGLVLATMLGACTAVFFVPYAVMRFAFRGVDYDRAARLLAGEPTEQKRLRRLREQAERKREIELLERELGIGVDA